MTNCWAIMYAVPRETSKMTLVSVNEDGPSSQEQFFWIALQAVYKAERGGKSPLQLQQSRPRAPAEFMIHNAKHVLPSRLIHPTYTVKHERETIHLMIHTRQVALRNS